MKKYVAAKAVLQVNFRLVKGIREIFGCQMWNLLSWVLESGIQNPTNDWNSESKFYWQILESSRISIFNNDFKVLSTRFQIFIAYSKISTLNSGFKKLRIYRIRVDGSRIRKEKVANSVRSLNVTLNAWMRTAILDFVAFFSCLSVNN